MAHAKVIQLVINKKTVNKRPESLRGLTSLNPTVVMAIVVMYNASINVYPSIAI